jgi:hypothetical protein
MVASTVPERNAGSNEAAVRKAIVLEFVSLDGVIEDPSYTTDQKGDTGDGATWSST